MLAHIDPASQASTSASAGSTSGFHIFSQTELASLRTVEERTRVEWMQRVAIDHELWQRRQRVLAVAREADARRAYVGLLTGEVPPAPPLPTEFARVQGMSLRARAPGAAQQVDSDEDGTQDPDYRPSQD